MNSSFSSQQISFLFSILLAGAILNSTILPVSAVHPASANTEIKGRLEVQLKMDEPNHIMKMGLFIKACINATCLYRKAVFDGTEIPGQWNFIFFPQIHQRITLRSRAFVPFPGKWSLWTRHHLRNGFVLLHCLTFKMTQQKRSLYCLRFNFWNGIFFTRVSLLKAESHVFP